MGQIIAGGEQFETNIPADYRDVFYAMAQIVDKWMPLADSV